MDTLLGTWLPPWKLTRATKQVQHAKFHLFDAGVARALNGRLPYPPSPEELGPLLETYILQELRAYLEYAQRPYPLHFWRSHDGVEVDVLFETPDGFVALEIKACARLDKRFQKGLNRIRAELGAGRVRTYGIYLGETAADWDATRVLPAMDFLQRLWGGDIVSGM